MNQITLSQFLLNAEKQSHIDAQLRLLIETLAESCIGIANAVSQGALANLLGAHGTENIQGEVQQKLDVYANDKLIAANSTTGSVAAMASEEMDTIVPVENASASASYLLLFDPLDGSSNIDVNVSIGTIFSVLCAPKDHATPSEADFLQTGDQQVAAGYIVYGPQTQLILTIGQGVHGFTLDKQHGNWQLTHPDMRIPADTSEFAINMSNQRHWHAGIQAYIQDCLAGEQGPLKKNYNMRWIASMVADVHRLLTRGGVFMYPRDQRPSTREGKLRLLYEANPMGWLVEQAGGSAIDGDQRILDITPTRLHQRVGVILGSKNEVATIDRYLKVSE